MIQSGKRLSICVFSIWLRAKYLFDDFVSDVQIEVIKYCISSPGSSKAHQSFHMKEHNNSYLRPLYEKRKLLQLVLQIFTIDTTIEIEHLCSIVDFSPKSMFQQLLRLLKVFACPEMLQST